MFIYWLLVYLTNKMERNYNRQIVQIVSEAVIVGGISMYFYKKTSDLESSIEELKQQVATLNNRLRLVSLNGQPSQQGRTTPLCQKEPFIRSCPTNKRGWEDALTDERVNGPTSHVLNPPSTQPALAGSNGRPLTCKDGVCMLPTRAMGGQRLGSKAEEAPPGKKVVISKISKQIEYDTSAPVDDRFEGTSDDVTKVNTFTKCSPNPAIMSVTPNPSTSICEDMCDPLDTILNDIDAE